MDWTIEVEKIWGDLEDGWWWMEEFIEDNVFIFELFDLENLLSLDMNCNIY